MAEYITRASLEFNGTLFEDFTSFTESSVTLAKQVPLMNKTGTAKLTPRYAFSVDAVRSSIPPSVNLGSIFGGTFTVQTDNGDRITFGGVATLESGDASIDGENEATQSISFGAETRTPALDI